MPFVPAICTQCGAKIEVDNTKDAAICQYCGAPFIVEKAINHYHTYNTTNNTIYADKVIVQNENATSFFKIEHNVLLRYTGYEEVVTVPNGVVRIEDNAFRCGEKSDKSNSYVKIINLPSSCRAVGNGSFMGCSKLEKINGLENILEIGNDAFRGCSSLKNINLQFPGKKIPSGAFDGCSSLENINIPASIIGIGARAFRGCSSLTNLTFPTSIVAIEGEAFQNCKNLTGTFYLPNLTSIGANVFDGTGYSVLDLSSVRINFVYPIITIGHLPNLKTIKITSELWKHYYYEDGYGLVHRYHILSGPSSILEYIYIDGTCHDFHSSIALDTRLEETLLYKKAKEQKERQDEKKRLEETEQLETWKRLGRCSYCGGHFKGLFTERCVKCGKVRNY